MLAPLSCRDRGEAGVGVSLTFERQLGQDGTAGCGPVPGSTVNASAEPESVSVVEGVTAACPSSPPTPALCPSQQPHLDNGSPGMVAPHHHRRPVLRSWECGPSRRPERCPYVRRRQNLPATGWRWPSAIPGRTPPAPQRSPTQRLPPARLAPTSLTVQDGFVRRCAGGSVVVAAETAIVCGRLRTSLKAAAPSA